MKRKHSGEQDGQYRYHRINWYCPKCHSTGNSAHYGDCDGTKVSISATARFPKKNASKKTWDKFYDKFVLGLERKDFFRKKWKERVERLNKLRQLNNGLK